MRIKGCDPRPSAGLANAKFCIPVKAAMSSAEVAGPEMFDGDLCSPAKLSALMQFHVTRFEIAHVRIISEARCVWQATRSSERAHSHADAFGGRPFSWLVWQSCDVFVYAKMSNKKVFSPTEAAGAHIRYHSLEAGLLFDLDFQVFEDRFNQRP